MQNARFLSLAMCPPYLPDKGANPISSVPMPAYQMGNPPTGACVGFAIVGKTAFLSVTGTISQAIASRRGKENVRQETGDCSDHL